MVELSRLPGMPDLAHHKEQDLDSRPLGNSPYVLNTKMLGDSSLLTDFPEANDIEFLKDQHGDLMQTGALFSLASREELNPKRTRFSSSWSLKFPNEAMNKDFIHQRAIKNKPFIILFMVLWAILSAAYCILSLLRRNYMLFGVSAVCTVFCTIFGNYVQRSPNYARIYPRSVDILFVIMSGLVIYLRLAERNRNSSTLNTIITLIFLTWLRGNFRSGACIAIGGCLLFFAVSITYMDWNDILRTAVPFTLSTTSQLFVSFYLEMNDRRSYEGQMLTFQYKAILYQKETKTNEILRKIYPAFVSEELRVAQSLDSFSHVSNESLIMHLRLSPAWMETESDRSVAESYFDSLKSFQRIVDKLCKRSKINGLFKIKFFGDDTLMVCGFRSALVARDIKRCIQLIEKLKLFVSKQYPSNKFVGLISMGCVEGGIIICQKQSFDAIGSGISRSQSILDQICTSNEGIKSRVVVTENVLVKAEVDTKLYQMLSVRSKAPLFERMIRSGVAMNASVEDSAKSTISQNGLGEIKFGQNRDADAYSFTMRTVSMCGDEVYRSPCLLPGEGDMNQKELDGIAERVLCSSLVYRLRASILHLVMMVGWTIFWGVLENHILSEQDLDDNSTLLILNLIRFYVITPCLVLGILAWLLSLQIMPWNVNLNTLRKTINGVIILVTGHGLFLAWKFCTLLQLSYTTKSLQVCNHTFFQNEFLLWVLLATTNSLTNNKIVHVASLFWGATNTILTIVYRAELEFHDDVSLTFGLLLYILFVMFLVISQGKAVLLMRQKEFETSLSIQKEIHLSRIEQRLTERIVLSVIPSSLYVALSRGSFDNKPYLSKSLVVSVNIARFSSVAATLDAPSKISLVSGLFQFLENFAAKYKIHPLKTFGDRFMFICEDDSLSETVVRCVRFAMDLQATPTDDMKLPIKLPLLLKVSICYGEVVSGIVDADGLSYHVIGNSVSRASLLSRICPSGHVVVDMNVKNDTLVQKGYDIQELKSTKYANHPECFSIREADDIWGRFISYVDWMSES